MCRALTHQASVSTAGCSSYRRCLWCGCCHRLQQSDGPCAAPSYTSGGRQQWYCCDGSLRYTSLCSLHRNRTALKLTHKSCYWAAWTPVEERDPVDICLWIIWTRGVPGFLEFRIVLLALPPRFCWRNEHSQLTETWAVENHLLKFSCTGLTSSGLQTAENPQP